MVFWLSKSRFQGRRIKKSWLPFILRNIWEAKSDQRGVTLIELLIAMLLTSLLLIFVFSLQLFTNKLVIAWQKKADLENQALVCIKTMSTDFRNLKEILHASKNRIEFYTEKNRKTIYEYREGAILRNGKRLNENNIQIDGFQLNYFSKPVLTKDGYSLPKDEYSLDQNLNLSLDNDELGKITGVKIKLTFKSYDKNIELENFVRLKKAISVY